MSVKPPPREAAAEALHILRESHPDPKAASPEAHALAKTMAEDELEVLAQSGSGHAGKRGAPEELPTRRSGPERSDDGPR